MEEKDRIIEDKELGVLVVRVNPRAKRMIFRTKNDVIYVSVPPGTTSGEVTEAINQLRIRLHGLKEKTARPLINLDYRIDSEYFKLSLVSGEGDRFLAHSELGEMRIVCPATANFADTRLQEWLHKVVEEALRRNAKIILPPRLYMWSQQHKLPYRSIKINSSRGRWGSCSSRKDINLSYFLVLLPQHLIDYVLLHELCHTLEMNHSDRFWALLDSLTGGKALALREELKGYRTEI